MTVSQTVTDKHAPEELPVKRLAVASAIGTIIEAYDFVLYGTVAASPCSRRGRRSSSCSRSCSGRFVRDRGEVAETEGVGA
jgi:hypothetical protein